jgi:hypothetical protein
MNPNITNTLIAAGAGGILLLAAAQILPDGKPDPALLPDFTLDDGRKGGESVGAMAKACFAAGGTLHQGEKIRDENDEFVGFKSVKCVHEKGETTYERADGAAFQTKQ